jgi:sulfur carrier protein ThiS
VLALPRVGAARRVAVDVEGDPALLAFFAQQRADDGLRPVARPPPLGPQTVALGQGRTLEAVLTELGQVAEGVITARSARQLGERLGVELPITEEIYNILYAGNRRRRR